jgi:type 1 glutamine amidotransferase
MMRTIAFLLSVLVCLGAETPLKVCLISGSIEYRSDESLAVLKKYLEERTGAQCSLIQGRGELNRFKEYGDLPGLDALDRCDVALVFTRRMTIEGEQLERIKRYMDGGRPVVAVRTASHGFQNWLEFDKLVLGGNYGNHFGSGPTQTVKPVPAAKTHPVLDGVTLFQSRASLYRTSPLAEDCELLMTSETPQASQPAAWVRVHRGGRVFYTSLGSTEDFQNGTFLRLLANALHWTAKRDIRWNN